MKGGRGGKHDEGDFTGKWGPGTPVGPWGERRRYGKQRWHRTVSFIFGLAAPKENLCLELKISCRRIGCARNTFGGELNYQETDYNSAFEIIRYGKRDFCVDGEISFFCTLAPPLRIPP